MDPVEQPSGDDKVGRKRNALDNNVVSCFGAYDVQVLQQPE